MGLEISKRCSSYTFHLVSAMRTLATNGRIQAVTFLGNRASFKKIVAL